MKKLYAVVIFFVAAIVFTALWFSPFASLGTPQAYSDNAPVESLDGLCYAPNTLVRFDTVGGEDELYSALKVICACEVKSVRMEDGMLLVYAYSPRVGAEVQYLRDGTTYNVMAACDGQRVCLGAPILSGCY